jgi:hypothetical protein
VANADELNQLEAEFKAAAPAEESASAETAETDEPEAKPAPTLKPEIAARAWGNMASFPINVVCMAKNVALVTNEEAMTLGEAVRDLLEAYDIGPEDARFVAIIGMIGAVSTIAQPRIQYVIARNIEAKKRSAEREPADGAKRFAIRDPDAGDAGEAPPPADAYPDTSRAAS